MYQKHLQKKKKRKKKDNLDEQQLYELTKLISKRQKQLSKDEHKKKQIDRKSITKIVSSKKKANESFNVDIINNKDP